MAICPKFIDDGFCVTITTEDGYIGFLVTGGLAGIREFHPLFPAKGDE